MLDVTSLDGSYCVDAAQGRFDRSERPEALAVAEEALHGSAVALDQIVSPLPIDGKRPIVSACRVNSYSLKYCRYCRRY